MQALRPTSPGAGGSVASLPIAYLYRSCSRASTSALVTFGPPPLALANWILCNDLANSTSSSTVLQYVR